MNRSCVSLRLLLVFLITVLLLTRPVLAQVTNFTYQGKLVDGANAANGNYDLQFALFDNSPGGSQIGPTLTRPSTNVSSGIFTVQLDFGTNAFPGANRFLEIGVRQAGIGSFTILAPRQQISSTPYAIRTLTAGAADTLSSVCVACVQDSQINSVTGSKVSGVIPVEGVPAGSGNYIQSTNNPQTNANFNIDGNGTMGGRLGIATNSPEAKVDVRTPALEGIASNHFFGFIHSDDYSTRTRLGSYINNPRAGYVRPWGAFFGTLSDDDLNFITNGNTKLTIFNNGNVGIGTGNNTANHRLSIIGGPTWTSNLWFGSMEFANGGALGWRSNPSGNRFGIGQTDSGFIIFATASDPGNTANPTLAQIQIDNNGNVNVFNSLGIGASASSITSRLDVRGNLTLDAGNGPGPAFYTSSTNGEQNKYLHLLNSPSFQSASGLKAGGILVADSYGYANPGKNELVVKGRIRVGDLAIGGDTPLCRNNSTNEIALCNASSLRYKTNIEPYKLGLELILRLHPISFKWKETGRADLGLGAEDVARVAPSLTFANAKGETEGVRYERLNVVLINAVQQQQVEISRQREAISRQQTALDRLEKTNTDLMMKLRLLEMRHRPTRTRPGKK